MDSILTLISQKKAMLEVARAKVSELEQQIATLSSMVKEDEFDRMLASKIKAVSSSKSGTTDAAPYPSQGLLAEAESWTEVQPVATEATKTGRNPKGTIRRVLLEVLADGQERDLDYILNELNARLPSQISRGALRTALMIAKKEKEVFSRKAGMYQLPEKGESPAGTGLSDATESLAGHPTLGV